MSIKIFRKNNFVVVDADDLPVKYLASNKADFDHVQDGEFVVWNVAAGSEGYTFFSSELRDEYGNEVGDTEAVVEYLTSNINFKAAVGGSTDFKHVANNYTELITDISPIAEEGDLALVYNSQGVWMVNRKLKGVYIYQSALWVYANQEIQNYLSTAIQPNDNISLLSNDSLYIKQSGARNSISVNSSNDRELQYDSISGVISYVSPSSVDFYKELTYSSGDLSKIETYEDATKVNKLFTKDLTYTAGSLTQIVLTNETTSTTETKTLSYDVSGNLINITKT